VSISPAPAAVRAAPAPGALARAGSRARAIGWLVPVAVSLLILAWQAPFQRALPPARPGDALEASSGLLPDLPCFFYFYYHLGLFPVGAREAPTLGPARADALDFVAHHGDRLRMDFGGVCNTPRFGDYGKLFTLWPDAWLSGDPRHASPLPFNQALFVLALLATWWAFWRERRPLLGAVLVALVGSNPFQLHETYARANVFSLPITVALLALAAHLPWLTGRRALDRGAWALACASGIVLATVREIRTEAVLVGVALVATYLTVRSPWPRRAALAGVFVVAWTLTGAAWTGYWSRGFERSARFVTAAGGRAFTGAHGYNHALWHAVWCGLGDYGADRGFAWDDRVAYRWATTPSAANPRPLPWHYRDGYYLEETWDGVNHVAPTDLPRYNQLMRDRVLGAVRAEPLWYAGVLLKRAGAILGNATPATLTLGLGQVRLPGAGWLLLPVLGLALALRRAFETRLLLFTLPLSAVALLVYSGRGMTAYGIAHLVALAVLVDWAARARRATPEGTRHAH
jgi:hypothetical protein